MIAAVRKVKGPRLKIVGALLFINALVLGLAWISLDSSYRQHQERAAATSRNTNRLVSQSIVGDIEQIDLALRAIGDEIMGLRDFRDARAVEATLVRLQSRLRMTDALRVANADGEVIASSEALSSPVSIADRSYYTKLRDDPAAALIVSEPIQGRISGKWVLIFARRLSLPDGSFAGVAFAPVTISWFESKFNDLEVGPQGTVVMRGDASRNFDLLARFPHAGFVGQTTVSDTFRARIKANPQGGTYEAVAGADNIRRTFSYQQVAGYPLITLVGLATDDYLAEWKRDAIKIALLAGAFVLVTLTGGLSLARTWRTLERRTEELARSNADLEQFAYVASHDLRTPLRNIASYAQLLQRRYQGRLDADADEFIGYIVGGAKHMSAMIPDLLEYARVSRSPPDLVPTDLTAVINATLTNLGQAVEEAGAVIDVAPLPVVFAEARQAESLFQNLLENALTYRNPDRPLRVEVFGQPVAKDEWRIGVRDNGIGIDEAYFDKIFIIFQRLEPGIYPEGTGIGLALCRRIMDRFGGDIWVESRPGEGSTFYFTLRAADSGPTPKTSSDEEGGLNSEARAFPASKFAGTAYC